MYRASYIFAAALTFVLLHPHTGRAADRDIIGDIIKVVAKPAVPQTDELRIAIEGAYPPFSEKGPKGALQGFDVDIAKALCAELMARCELVQSDWDRIQDAVLGKAGIFGNDFDAIVASVSITDSRRQTVDFTDKYYHVPARFVRRQGTDIGVADVQLDGRRIGVQGNTTHAEFALQRFGGKSEIVTFETLPEATAALSRGEVDVVLGDALALAKGVLAHPEGRGLEFVGPNYTDRRWFGQGAGIAVAKGNAALRTQLDQALDRIVAQGTYDRIAKSYFGFDILSE
jgi:arginine/ornithine transport system substrate-binding protein